MTAARRNESVSKHIHPIPQDGIFEGCHCYGATIRKSEQLNTNLQAEKSKKVTASRRVCLSFNNASKSVTRNLLILLYLIDYKSSPKNS